MKKRIFAALLILLLAAGLLSGCRTEFTEQDVRDYIEETLELEHYKILSGPEDRINPEEYRDEWWTVTTTDFDPESPFTFHVINHMSYSGEWASNYLTDDLNGLLFQALAKKYAQSTGTPYEMSEDWENAAPASKQMHLRQDDSYILYSGFLWYPVEERSDFEDVLTEVKKFQEYIRRNPKLKDFSLRMEYEIVTPENCESIEADTKLKGSIYRFPFTADTSESELLECLNSFGDYTYRNGAVYEYLGDCIEYGLKNRTAEFSKEEIKTCIEKNEDLRLVRDVDGNVLNDTVVYDNLYSSISPGSLYDLLLDRNIPVNGNWWHYSFTGKDGESYEISYVPDPETNMEPSYGFDASYLVPVEDVSKMLGINVDDGYPTYEVVIPSEVFALFELDPEDFINDTETPVADQSESKSAVIQDPASKEEPSEENPKADADDQSLEEFPSVTFASDGVHVKGKARQLSRLERQNNDRIDMIRAGIRDDDPDFYVYQRNLYKTFEGISFVYYDRDFDFSAHKEEFDEMIALTIINQFLDNPEDEAGWSFDVEFKYHIDDYKEEKTSFLLPDDIEKYRSFIMYGPLRSSPTSNFHIE